MRLLLCAVVLVGCGSRTSFYDPADDPWAGGDAGADGSSCGLMPCAPSYARGVPPASQPFIDACSAPGRVMVLPSIDDNSARVPMGFNFTFWGRVIPQGAQINVTSNGWFGMNSTANALLRGTVPGAPLDAVAPYLMDLITRTGVCVATVGVAPQRSFVVEWIDAMFYSGRTGSLTFEAVLHERTNTLDFLYLGMSTPVPMGYSPAVGLNNLSPTTGVAVCSGVGACPAVTSGTRIRFTPTGG